MGNLFLFNLNYKKNIGYDNIVLHNSEGTQVNGFISSNTTWNVSESPYYITGNLVVESGAKLTIEQGVKVLFNGSYSIVIDGALNATGTPVSPIIFSSNATNPQKSDWESILIRGSDSMIKNTIISYANKGIKLDEGLCEIYNCTFYNNSDGIYIEFWYGLSQSFNLNINNNTFFQNDNGIYIYRLSESYYTYLNIELNRIFNNSNNGIYITGVRLNDLTIQNNRIFNNSEYGIQIKLGVGVASYGWKFINI